MSTATVTPCTYRCGCGVEAEVGSLEQRQAFYDAHVEHRDIEVREDVRTCSGATVLDVRVGRNLVAFAAEYRPRRWTVHVLQPSVSTRPPESLTVGSRSQAEVALRMLATAYAEGWDHV